MISDLQVATTKFREVLGVLRKPCFEEFVLYLQFAEVYGAGYLDDVDYAKFNQRSTLTHKQQLIDELGKLIEMYDMALIALNLQKNQGFVGKLEVYHKEFSRMIIFQ